MNPARRNALIASGVLVFHAAALWALNSGLLRRAVEIVVPVEVLSEIITPAPKVETPPPAAPKVEPTPKKLPPPPRPEALPVPAPPSPNAPVATTLPQPPAPPIATPVAAEPSPPAPPAAPAPPKIELPSSDATYLQNPSPVYPPVSKRMGEQGKVVVRVLIGADGLPQRAEVKVSSGFDRLDRAALDYILKCRYRAGTVNGVPQAMWKDAPVNFVLE
ncbi:MAG TPA: TonB family protein [Ramlibacter sp.]|nr:TonB family protein [Ramlibacter sp.]